MMAQFRRDETPREIRPLICCTGRLLLMKWALTSTHQPVNFAFVLLFMHRTSPSTQHLDVQSEAESPPRTSKLHPLVSATSRNIRRHLKTLWGHLRTSLETSRDSLGWSGCAAMKIKERVLRDQAALSGLQLGLMAAEHRLGLALIWMSTRRLVLCLPASLCALPRFAVCQWIALTACQGH